jgi:SAM-dependent methyltransferase
MSCILCQSDERALFNRVESFGFPLVYYRCGHCGLVYQEPGASRAADPAFYEETYRTVYQASPEPTRKDLWVQSQRARHLIRLLEKQDAAPPSRMLDIGASAGLLLEAFRTAFDCAVVGVEPGNAYRAYAAGNGIPMFASLDALLADSPRPFDLVSLIHVLEHLPDPVEILGTIRRDLLAEGGLLLLEVPNFYAHDSYELAHLACYTPHTLRAVLKRSGYRILTLRAHGVPRSALLPLYLTVLAEPLAGAAEAPAPVRGELLVGMKRRVTMLWRRLIQRLFPHRAWLPLPGKEEG